MPADWTVLTGDNRQTLATIAPQSVDLCVTSPPYYGLRKYGEDWEGGQPLPCPACSDGRLAERVDAFWTVERQRIVEANGINWQHQRDWEISHCGVCDGTCVVACDHAGQNGDYCAKCGAVRSKREIGREQTPEQYLAALVDVFRLVRAALKPTGSVWVNLGDSYGTGGSGNNGKPDSHSTITGAPQHGAVPKLCVPGFTGQLLGIPWRFALAMQADGWTLRSDIIWAKGMSFLSHYSGSCMPQSQRGTRWERCRVNVSGTGWGGNDGSVHPSKTLDGLTMTRANKGGVNQDGIAKWTDCPGCPKCSKHGGLVLRRGQWRPTTGHEYVFLFTLGDAVLDCEAVRERQKTGANGSQFHVGKTRHEGTSEIPRQQHGARNLRTVWAINPEPDSTRVETDHWHRVVSGVLGDDIQHKVSEGCPVHGCLGSRHDVRAASPSLHTSDRCENPEAVPSTDSSANSTVCRAARCEADNTDFALLIDCGSATPHNTPDCKTALARGTSAAGSVSSQNHVRTGDTSRQPESCGPDRGTRASSILSDEPHGNHETETRDDNTGTCTVQGETSIELLIDDGCTCEFYRQETKKTSHYAMYPRKLVRPIVTVATSARGCCPACGAPWARVMERGYVSTGDHVEGREGLYAIGSGRDDKGAVRTMGGREFAARKSSDPDKTLGFRPTCDCGREDVAPSVVLDPFHGGGTTGIVCDELSEGYGCKDGPRPIKYIGCELHEEYLPIGETRRKRFAERRAESRHKKPKRQKPVELGPKQMELF